MVWRVMCVICSMCGVYVCVAFGVCVCVCVRAHVCWWVGDEASKGNGGKMA